MYLQSSSVAVDLGGPSYQNTSSAVALNWNGHFSQAPQFCTEMGVFAAVCKTGIVSYSYSLNISAELKGNYPVAAPCSTRACLPCPTTSFNGTSQSFVDTRPCLTSALQNLDDFGKALNCVGCLTMTLNIQISACNEVQVCVADTFSVLYSGTAPEVSSLNFSPNKIPYAGKLWFADVQSAIFNATFSSPTIPWQTGQSDIELRISVGGYPGNALTRLFDGQALQTSALFLAAQSAALLQATSLKFLGDTFHGEPYQLLLKVQNAIGSVGTSAATVYLDEHPPTLAYARFSELVFNKAAQWAKVVISGLFDPESGIKELWTRAGDTRASVCASDFGSASTWQNFTSLSLSATNSPLADQTIDVDLTSARTYNWSQLYFAAAVTNNAWTNLNDTSSVTYVCLDPLSLVDFSAASIAITHLDVVGDSQSQLLSNESTIEIHWITSNVPAGVASMTANLSIPDRPTVYAGPFYDKTASIDISAGSRIPNNVTVEACVAAKSNLLLAEVSTCYQLFLPLPVVFDASCVQTGVTYNKLQDGDLSATGTIFANWSTCVFPDVAQVTYWLVSTSDFHLVIHGAAAVTDGGVPLSIDASWEPDTLKFCFMGLTSAGSASKNFCVDPQIVDPTPPRSLGGVYDAYSGNGLVTDAPVVRSATNTAQYVVRWDPWADADSDIQSYGVTLVNDLLGSVAGPILNIPADQHIYMFSNLILNVSSDYHALLTATNMGGLQGLPVRSAGVHIFATTGSGSPLVVVNNGIDVTKAGRPAKLFLPRNNPSIEVSWTGFVGDAAQFPKYRVELMSISNVSATASPLPRTTGQQDVLFDVPPLEGVYSLAVTLLNSGGTSKRAVYAKDIWVSQRLRIVPPTLSQCAVNFSTFDPLHQTVELTASLTPASDPDSVLVNQTLGFRRANMQSQSSSTVSLGSTDNQAHGVVKYIYGPPSLLDDYGIECVWEAIDVTGTVTSAVFSQTQSYTVASGPTVFALSTWTKVALPSSATDFAFFDDVSITPNNSFMVGMQSFPPVIQNGVQVASLSYSISYYNGSTAYQVPWTAVDVTGTLPPAQYQVLFGSSLIPITVFEPTEFAASGGFMSDLSTVYICVMVTSFASNTTESACSNGITFDSLPPSPGSATISGLSSSDYTTQYLTSANTITVAWSGFFKSNWQFTNDSGIAAYQWGVGSFAGADDYVPFSIVDGMQANATAEMKLTDGSSLYATVIALDHAGRAVTAVSPLVIVDSSPPVAGSGLAVLAKINHDGSTFVRVDFMPWRDGESGISTVVWTIESVYGAADLLPFSPVTFSNLAYASLQLLPGVTYLVRVTATNRATLTTELVSSFTTGRPVQLVYLVDGSNPLYSKPFDNRPSEYTAAWQFTGDIVSLTVGVGTAPRQDDIFSFERVDTSVESLTTPLRATDGVRVYTTIFVQDSGGKHQSFVSPGMLCDSSGPIRGWVSVGGTVHQMTVPEQAMISASWIGFSDPESDIRQYEYCLDLTDDVESPQCSIASWVNVWTARQVVDAAIIGAILPVNQLCYVKVRATNNAGLAVIATSPPFSVDSTIPQLGEITVAFPGGDAFGSPSISPVASDGTQLYLDTSCVNVSWSPGTGRDLNYRVALYQASGAVVIPFTSVGVLRNYMFTGLQLANQGPGAKYLAVVEAWTAAGIHTEASKPFQLVNDPPGPGSVTVLSVSRTSISFYVKGFFDVNYLAVKYEVSIGRAQNAADQAQSIFPFGTCGRDACTLSVSAAIAPAVVYFLTVRAVNEAGLSSDVTSLPFSYPAPLSAGTLDNSTFLWNVTAAIPFVNANRTAAVLTGTNLQLFMTASASVAVTCNWNVANGTRPGTLAVGPVDDDRPQITCPDAPWGSVSDGNSLMLNVTIQDKQSNPLAFMRSDLPPSGNSWNSSIPQCGLFARDGSQYRVSTALTFVKWTTETKNIAYFRMALNGNTLAQKWPSTSRNATILAALPSLLTVSVCAYYFDTASSCVSAPIVMTNLIAPTINPAISTAHDGPLSTTVRVTSAPNLLPLGTSQYVGSTAVSVSWADTFVASGSKAISNYFVMLGTAPKTASNGSFLSTNDVTASFTVDLVAGVPYFATVVAVDEIGLRSIQFSSSFIVDTTPPDLGTVHIGRSYYPKEVAWQTSLNAIEFYLRGWSDHTSGISGFTYRLCTAQSCSSSSYIGLAIENSANASLVGGVPYWISVQVSSLQINNKGLHI
ncbi:hypothetical protein BDZ88DRAFT_83861 [Geranomyces variabilis]|nr:hypothetical protein BDZ88DRAFT_83861 [Geranomyces variabilis]